MSESAAKETHRVSETVIKNMDARQIVGHLLENDDVAGEIDRLTDPANLPNIIWLEDAEDYNPMCECPYCHQRGRLMDAFSLIEPGFNGINPGDEIMTDVQECGSCGKKMRWDYPDDAERQG